MFDLDRHVAQLRELRTKVDAALAQRNRRVALAKHPFDYHRPSPAQVEQISTVRTGCKELHAVLMALPPGRERSLAITKLEEVSMWANKAIIMADEGEVDDGKR
jgi:hypothetical protein